MVKAVLESEAADGRGEHVDHEYRQKKGQAEEAQAALVCAAPHLLRVLVDVIAEDAEFLRLLVQRVDVGGAIDQVLKVLH